MSREPLFEFTDEFAIYLQENGVERAWKNYLSWMNRAARMLERPIGPEDLTEEGDVERLLYQLIDVAKGNSSFDFARGSVEESNQRSVFRKYAEMVRSNYRGLFREEPEAGISPSRFHRVFERFQKIHKEKCGFRLDSFANRESFAFQWEGYKQAIPERAAAALRLDRWTLKGIGSGEILERVVEAIELQGNNLLQWEARQGPASRAHSRMLEAGRKADTRRDLETRLYELFKRNKTEKETFEALVELCGKRYELLAYLFFIAKPGRFLPLRTRSFDRTLAELGVDLKTEGQCGWENYLAFIRAMEAVRERLHSEGILDATLLDAHSFCWILARHKVSEGDKKQEARARTRAFQGEMLAADKQRDFTPNDDAEIRDMQRESFKRQASGQIAEEIALNAERERLSEEGRGDLSPKVESVSNRPGLGYDIHSFDADGTERFIEVKNVTNGSRFFLSEGEWLNSRQRKNYWFYLVSRASSDQPIVDCVPASALAEQHLQPVQYLVRFSAG